MQQITGQHFQGQMSGAFTRLISQITIFGLIFNAATITMTLPEPNVIINP